MLRQLKGYCKSEKYESIKADIRRLINFGRKSELALEHKMLEIQSMATSQPVPVSEGSDLARFQDCLEQLNHLCLCDLKSYEALFTTIRVNHLYHLMTLGF
ncbi:hypothetical protein VAEU17_1360001 [Vibrio aestuarianus]|nr:hypothetical protein VAEU17_1360001 [Vibrio aestuarianus]